MHIQEMFNELRLKRPVHEEDIEVVRRKWVPQVWSKHGDDDGRGEKLTFLDVIKDGEEEGLVRVELDDGEVLVDHYLTEEAQNEVEHEVTIETVQDSNSLSEYEIEEEEEQDEDDDEEEVDDEDIAEEEDEEVEQHIERQLRPKREDKNKMRKIEKKTNSHNVKGPYQR